MKIKLVPVMFLVFGLVLCGSLSAYPMGRPMGQGGEKKFVERMSKALGLTNEQKDKLAAQFKSAGDRTKPLMEKNRELMKKVEAEMQKDSPNASAVKGLIEEIGRNETQVQIIRTSAILDFKRSLTPEQKKKFKDIFDGQRGKRDKQFKKQGMEPPRGPGMEPPPPPEER